MEDQAHLSLTLRAAQQNSNLGAKIWSLSTLRKAYKRLGIRYKKVLLKRASRRPDQEILITKDQEIFRRLHTVTLGGTRTSAEEIVYLDECVFSHKSYKHMAWSQKLDNITQCESLGAQPAVAVLAAVSIRQGLILWHLRPKSFNAQSFCDFLDDLR